MKKLGVLVLAQPKNGGTLQYTISTLEALKYIECDWEITLYTTENNGCYDDMGFPIKRLPLTNLTIVKLLLSNFFSLSTSDVFSGEDAVLAPIYSSYLLQTKIPFTYTLHDLQEYYYPRNFSLLQRLWRRYIHAKLTVKASRVLCESFFVKDDIVRFFKIKGKKIHVVVAPPLAVDISTSANLVTCEEVQLKYSLPKMYLFYPAQFWPHKNHIRLVEAFALIEYEFPDCHLVLTGKKRDEYWKVFDRIKELGLDDRVNHIGYVDQDDFPGLYTLASALVMPTLFESVSIPIYEAFQYGVPVCASNVVALPEQVGDAGILFDPMSAQSMATALRALLSDSKLRDKIEKKGHETISQMTHEKYASQLACVLNSDVL